MYAYIKSFATYRTVKQLVAISWALTVDSLSTETSTVTVIGTDVAYSNTGNWLIIDNNVYRIKLVKPQTDRTLLTLESPLDAFSRPLEYSAPPISQSIGGFLSAMLHTHWIECPDSAYIIPYLTVSNSDTSGFAPPDLDDSGFFDFAEYARLMRKSYRTTMRFTDAGSSLVCTISCPADTPHQVSFDDGRSQLQSVDYSSSGTAKLTTICDVETGDVDADGEAITYRQRRTWYLAEDGSISETIPARRASGKWDVLTVGKPEEVEAKVIQKFAKNKSTHKLEFWSNLDLDVLDTCTFCVYGEMLTSYISYKRKSSADQRYYYKSGELATTATEKLKGAFL